MGRHAGGPVLIGGFLLSAAAAAALGAAVGALVSARPTRRSRRWKGRSRGDLLRQWPGALRFLAGVLRAGGSADEGLETLRREAPAPLRTALDDGAYDPAGDPLLAAAFAGLSLAREQGAPAAQALESCARTLERRLEIADRARALTAQSRASAWIVGLAPPALFVGLWAVMPSFIQPFLTTSVGRALLVLMGMLTAAGLVTADRLARRLAAP